MGREISTPPSAPAPSIAPPQFFANPFRIRTYQKRTRNFFIIRTYNFIGLEAL